VDVPAHHGVDLARATRASRRAAERPDEASGREARSPADGGRWEIPVLTTNALANDGVAALVEAVDAHRVWLEASGELRTRRRARARGRVRDVVDRELRRAAWASAGTNARLDAGLDEIEAGAATPYSVARGILDALLR
jgi:LAO/AO transport system kinase